MRRTRMLFDNLEYLSIENQTTDFPKHFHETFCISLIHNGIEQIDFDNQTLFSEKGSISITNPYEIHSNPLTDKDICLKFDTIYLSNDLMKYLLNGQNIKFANRKINSEKANQLFMELKYAIDTKNPEYVEFSLKQFVNTLKIYSQENTKKYCEQNLYEFKDVSNYIEHNICEKFCLDELSKIANINKYGFIKKFKISTGMTPINYILMKKIFASKTLINPNSDITELAYLYNFCDLAHFSKTFKQYIGISPKKFQSSLI